MKNIVMSKELKIEIPEGYEVDKDKSTFEKIVFKKIEIKYPLRVQEIQKSNEHYYFIDLIGKISYVNRNSGLVLKRVEDNYLSSQKRAQAFLALMQLVELRDAWNKIDGKEVDWEDNICPKFSIFNKSNKISIGEGYYISYPISFAFKKTRDLFLETFKDLLETAKELL